MRLRRQPGSYDYWSRSDIWATTSSIQLVNAEGHHERTKHVDVYYHYIKDCIKEGYFSLQYVCTHNMAADGLTKPLDKHAHRRFLDQVDLRKPIIHSAITHVPVQD
jgi:hypothetical protein